MYAIIQTGGKQYKVTEGEFIDVEKLDGEKDTTVNFEVLMYSKDDKMEAGNPVLKNVTCEGKIIAQGKQSKIIVFKYKPKKNVRKKQGHRQPFTRVKIMSIKRV